MYFFSRRSRQKENMAKEAMIRTPKDTPTARLILIPFLDSEDALFGKLEAEPAIEVVLLEEGSKDVEDVSVYGSEDTDGLAVTLTVTLSVIISVIISVSAHVCFFVFFVDFVVCELALAAWEGLSNPHPSKDYSLQTRTLRKSKSSEWFQASWETYSAGSSGTVATRFISAAVCIWIVALGHI